MSVARQPSHSRFLLLAFLEQLAATFAGYFFIYYQLIVPRLEGVKAVGVGWWLLLASPNLIVTIHLSTRAIKTSYVAVSAFGSGLAVEVALIMLGAVSAPGFRKRLEALSLAESAIELLVLSACFFVAILLAGKFTRRRPFITGVGNNSR